VSKDEVQFRKVYDDYAIMIRRLMARLLPSSEVDDGVQEVFLKIHRHMHSFRGEAQMKSWVYRICINTAQDYHRSHTWRKLWKSFDSSPQLQEKSQNAEEQLGHSQVLARCLEQLTFKERSVLVLFYWENQKVEEIAENLAIPEGTVKSRLSIARSRLQAYLKQEGDMV